MKKVLITGIAGYIGSVLAKHLLDKGYFVRGIDSLYFGGESLISIYNHERFEFFRGDIRNEVDIRYSIKDIDAIVHLASIVGDPACASQPKLAEETNWISSKILYNICKETVSVKRFIFASTCSNYGKMKDSHYVNELSPLRPVSLYATLKVKFEKYILESNIKGGFCPTILRFATAYGLSPRMRFDLTVNEFIKEVVLGRELRIFGEKYWRPYCHVDDIANAIFLALKSSPSLIKKNVFGIGNTRENYQKKMIAEIILKLEPNACFKYIQKKEDPRDYRVNFNKIKKLLVFKTTKRVQDGLYEIHSALKKGLFSNPDSEYYYNNKINYDN